MGKHLNGEFMAEQSTRPCDAEALEGATGKTCPMWAGVLPSQPNQADSQDYVHL